MDTFTFRDMDYSQPLGPGGGRRARLPGVRHLHHPRSGVQRRLSLESGVPRQQARPQHRRAQFRQLRPGILGAGGTTWKADARRSSSPIRPGSGSGRCAPWRSACSRLLLLGRGRGLCQSRPPDPDVDAQEQVAGQCLQVQLLGDQHRLRRLLPDGAAVHHPGADLVPRPAVPVEVGTVPDRSLHLPVLDLHHRHGVRLGARPVLRLDVPLRLPVRAAVQDRRRRRPEALPVQAVQALA
jgi:hypothetical protein